MVPEVTAVITTHGRPLSVQRALASVRAETHPSVEIVIVDDGCGFESDLPLRVIRGHRLGVGRARNLGLDAARGEFVIFLDDDDVALPHRIATLAAAARRHHATLCFGMTRRHGHKGLANVPTHVQAGRVRFSDLLMCNPHVNAVLVKTDALRAVGGFDAEAKHFDDWSAWLRIADRGAVMWCIAEVVAEWRIHDDGLSGDIQRKQAMKMRILALFDRLQPSLSSENAAEVAMARRLVASAGIVTYDDYADAMAVGRWPLAVAGDREDGSFSGQRPTANSQLLDGMIQVR